MGDKSSIEWTDATWNPFAGCTDISPGCKNCYAKRMAARNLPGLLSPTTGEPFAIMTESGPRWTGKVETIESRMDAPTHWRSPRRVFVNSMSDTFHFQFPDAAIDRVFAMMGLNSQHTFIVLTKRSERLREWSCARIGAGHRGDRINELMRDWAGCWRSVPAGRTFSRYTRWPMPHVHIGVSAEDQQRLDERIEDLRATPAAVRWLSLEPLLGPINLAGRLDGIHWVVVGGESGPRARLCNVRWIREIVQQCLEARVPCFVKQLGAFPHVNEGKIRLKHSKGGDPAEWPKDLRVQEYPEVSNG